VNFHCAKARLKLSRDLLLSHTSHEEVENFELTTGELGLTLGMSELWLGVVVYLRRLEFIHTKWNEDIAVEDAGDCTSDVAGTQPPVSFRIQPESGKSAILNLARDVMFVPSACVHPHCCICWLLH
jgi:hypothetical protein